MRPCIHGVVAAGVHSPKYSLQMRNRFTRYGCVDIKTCAREHILLRSAAWQSAHMLVEATTQITTGRGLKRDCLYRLYTPFLAFTGG